MTRTLADMMPEGQWSARKVHDIPPGTDGNAAFNAAVIGLGPFLVLVRNKTNGYVFGCYSHDDFGSTSGAQAVAPETFLFTLGNVTGRPAKLVWNGSGRGMHFGNCGLHVGSCCDLYTCNRNFFQAEDGIRDSPE
eukprot:COSAG01_NODE_33446_length_564_cov_0.468817_1_plen_135_part_00